MSDGRHGSVSARLARAQLVRLTLALIGGAFVVAAIGLVRLARQFPSAAESPALLVPFLLPVAALALEAGALVALAAAQLSALASWAGARPAERARATLVPLVASLLVLLGAQLVPRGTEQPGRFANELIQSALDSCGAAADVTVPLLGLTVRCSEPRRITGPMPGAASVQVAMSALTFSDDLRRVEIRELALDAKRSLSVHLRARSASIAGMAPWSRGARTTPLQRLGVLVSLAVALWATGVLLGMRRAAEHSSEPSELPPARLRWLGAVLTSVPGATVATGFVLVDQGQSHPSAFAFAAAAGVAATALLRLLVRRMPQMFSCFRGF